MESGITRFASNQLTNDRLISNDRCNYRGMIQWTALGCLTLQFCLSPAFVLQAQAGWKPWQIPLNAQPSQTIALPPPPLPTNNTSPQAPPSNGTILTQVPAGTRLQMAYTSADRVVVTPEETMPLTLTVMENLIAWNGQVLIPVNSQVQGRLQPTNGGTQFIAENLIISGIAQPIPLTAKSTVITRREEIRKGTNVGAILSGAAIGAAAASAIDLIVGDGKIGIGTILMGAAIGAGTGWWTKGRTYTTVLVVNSQEDLDLTLDAALLLPQTPR